MTTDQQRDETRTQGEVVTLMTGHRRTAEEQEALAYSAEMVAFLRETANDIEKSGEACTNIMVLVRTLDFAKSTVNVDVRSRSDDDMDLAMLARAKDMILRR